MEKLTLQDVLDSLNAASNGGEWEGLKPDLLGNELNRRLAAKREAPAPTETISFSKYADMLLRCLICRLGCKHTTITFCARARGTETCSCECHEVWELLDETVYQEQHAPAAPADRETQLRDALEAVQKEFNSASRNTNRGYRFGEAVLFSSQTKEQVRAALADKPQPPAGEKP